MNNNPNKLVSIKSAVVNLIEDTQHEEYMMMLPTLIKWGLQADQKIGSYYQYKKVIRVLAVKDCKVIIEPQAVCILGIVLGDHGCTCGTIFDKIYSQFKTLPDAFDSNLTFTYYDESIGYDEVDWEIQGNNIVFPFGYDDGQLMTIMFLEYEMDNEKFPLVHYCNLEAITSFITLKLTSQKTHKTFLRGGNLYMDMAYKKQCRRDWNRECSNARAILGEPTNSQINEIGEILNNPLSGKGNVLLEKYYSSWDTL
jgi:hypothetical protein